MEMVEEKYTSGCRAGVLLRYSRGRQGLRPSPRQVFLLPQTVQILEVRRHTIVITRNTVRSNADTQLYLGAKVAILMRTTTFAVGPDGVSFITRVTQDIMLIEVTTGK